MGTKDTTSSGKTCQRWDSQAPHVHNWDVRRSNYRTLSDAENYCVGDGQHGGPWCYTTDPDTEWESCQIPFCRG